MVEIKDFTVYRVWDNETMSWATNTRGRSVWLNSGWALLVAGRSEHREIMKFNCRRIK